MKWSCERIGIKNSSLFVEGLEVTLGGFTEERNAGSFIVLYFFFGSGVVLREISLIISGGVRSFGETVVCSMCHRTNGSNEMFKINVIEYVL